MSLRLDHDAARTAQFRRRAIVLLLGLLSLTGLVDLWYQHHKESRFDPQILTLAQRYRVDPALVKAVIWRESRFNPRVRGRVGEIGLMQVRPRTALEWAQTELRRATFEGNLFEPDTNLQVGTWYLSKLLRRYAHSDNPIPYALADYNAGRNNVLRWIKGPAQTNSLAFVSQISFPATQDYIRSISRRALQYRTGFARAAGKS